jgi:hypothetical protein
MQIGLFRIGRLTAKMTKSGKPIIRKWLGIIWKVEDD